MCSINPSSHAVLSLLRDKTNNPTRTLRNTHLSLVIEGGAMKGVCLAGMLVALDEYAEVEAFDSVHGTSVGALVGAFFITGRAKIARDIFFCEAISDKFINFKNLFHGKAIMNLDWLIDHVFFQKRNLNLDNALTQFNIIATSIQTGKKVVFSTIHNNISSQTLKATSKIPFISGAPIKYDETYLSDGGLSQQIPLEDAIENGATHCLILLSRTYKKRLLKRNFLSLLELLSITAVYGRALGKSYWQKNIRGNEILTEVMATGLYKNVHCHIVYVPDTVSRLTRLTKSKNRIIAAEKACREEMWRHISSL